MMCAYPYPSWSDRDFRKYISDRIIDGRIEMLPKTPPKTKEYEHRVDRLIRIYAGTGGSVQFNFDSENGYWERAKCAPHKGLARYTRWDFWENPITILNTCDVCGKRSTPKKIHWRSGVFGWNFENNKDFSSPVKTMLCCGCWNKTRIIQCRKMETEECRKLLNKLTRSIAHERKNQNNRRIA